MRKRILASIMASLAGAIFIFSSSSHALEFSSLGGTFKMEGPINSGDASRFASAYLAWDEPPMIFHIDSPGGDVREAMFIGDFIRQSQTPVWSGRICNSACVLVLVSGVERMAQGTVGLHRPRYSEEYYSKLSSSDAAKAYSQATEAITEYMVSMGVHQAVIDRMFQADSGSLDILSAKEASALFGFRVPFYEEWIAAKCGRFTGDYAQAVKDLQVIERLNFNAELGKSQIYKRIEKLRVSGSKTF
ncbi:MAG TPA: hypothetical protein VJY57_10155 [Thiopseudomonas sp.]|nr:hypothetical protein [Thiopseudomonas sp.]